MVNEHSGQVNGDGNQNDESKMLGDGKKEADINGDVQQDLPRLLLLQFVKSVLCMNPCMVCFHSAVLYLLLLVHIKLHVLPTIYFMQLI